MTIREIDEEIQRLRNLRYEQETAQIQSDIEAAKKNVGRCFRIGESTLVMVTDVPRVGHTLHGRDFNKYQYPALYLTRAGFHSKLPFHEDTVFSGYWGEGNDMLDTPVEEITPEEFWLAFYNRLGSFESNIRDILKERGLQSDDD